MLKYFIFVLLAVILPLSAEGLSKKPAVIFASGNNKFVLHHVIESFYLRYPEARVIVQYGATGDLASAILEGVNYDIFLGADMEFAQKIYKAKKAATQPKKYAEGSLVLFIPGDKTLSQRKLSILKDSKIKHITIANKKTAPYGKAAIEVLKNLKLLDAVSSKIRYSMDISTAISNVVWYDDAGFLSKSALHSLPVGYTVEGVNWIEVESSLYTPIIQGFVVSEMGLQNTSAIKFIDFLLSPEAQAIYKAHGYK